jgi:ABC-2 type transport system ATP-binding protein
MGTDAQPVVVTVGLTKVFKDFWYRDRVKAVDSLDLEVRAGEVFGLLGPNGSGKSTTIKILLGLLYPTRGKVAVFGRAPTDVGVKDRIGFLPEESYLYRFLDARETLDYYGRLFRLARPERRRRVDELLKMVGLEREARRRVGEYSKGMARRIGLAQALINDPDLLILDEPTTGLDPIGTAQIKELIHKLNREHRKTILLSSHLLADVEDVCDRVSILYGGKRRALGMVGELLRRNEQTQITAERLGSETIERIRALIAEAEQKSVVSVNAPRERLESLFIRVVREAEAQQQLTSGAVGGGALPGFFGDRGAGQGEALIASLLAAGQAAEPPGQREGQAPPAEPAPEPRTEVIEQLVDTDRSKPQEAAAPPEPAEQAPDAGRAKPEPDQDVIDSLIQKKPPSEP